MRHLLRKPQGTDTAYKERFFTLQGDEMMKYIVQGCDGRRTRYFVSMKEDPKDPYAITEWWEVSKKEWEASEQTFIEAAHYFGKFYQWMNTDQVLRVNKVISD